jgi:uncharacterized membrane protein YbhN (UPF0104 family)
MKIKLPKISPRFLLRLLGTLLSIALLVVLLSQQGWDQIWTVMKQIPIWVLALSLGLQFISRFAVTMRWHVLLRGVEIPIRFKQSLRITFAGLFANNFLPTTIGGDVVRLGGILRLKYDRPISATSLIVDRLVGLVGMALALPLGIYAMWGALPLSASIMAIAPLRNLLQRILGILRKIWEALLLWLHRPRSLLMALVWTTVHMICLFGSIWLLLLGMQDAIPFWEVAGLWSITYFVTLLPISINGLGVQEVSIALLLINIGGVSPQHGLSAAVILRTLIMIASLPGAIFIPGLIANESSVKEGGDHAE